MGNELLQVYKYHLIKYKLKELTNQLHGNNASESIIYYAGNYYDSIKDTFISLSNKLSKILHISISNHTNLYTNMADCKYKQIHDHVKNEKIKGNKYGYIYKAIWIGDNG